MSLNDAARPPQRRRGRVLEEALLDAAWDAVVELGYDEFTIEAVAARAGTSRAVLYRRWPNKPDLVRDAVVHEVGKDFAPVPDTGSLRGDVVALMQRANTRRIRMATQLFTRLGGFYHATGTSLSELSLLVQGGKESVMDDAIQRAVLRGEIKAGQVSGRVARLPVDLFRHEVIMTLQPVPEEVIAEIVDTIFLPLVRKGSDQPGFTPG